MGKKSQISDAYIVVELRDAGDFGSIYMGGLKRCEEALERDLENLKDEIVKRVRPSDERGNTYIKYEREDVCEFCGLGWTEESDTFNGGCCGQDMEAEPMAEAVQ